MKKENEMDKDCLLMCELQGETFELSVDYNDTSSAIFLRRYMNSKAARYMDKGAYLESNLMAKDLLDLVNEEYGRSDYGSVKFSKNEMYWMGYIYRLMAYMYEVPSAVAYKIIKPSELRELFLPYHTLDPEQAMDRILESKGLLLDEEAELKRQFEIFKRARKEAELRLQERQKSKRQN